MLLLLFGVACWQLAASVEMGCIGAVERWQRDADACFRGCRYLPFWRPRVLAKDGWFSPWFWPFLWLTRSGAFSLFCFVIVSRDLLGCPDAHRRAIVAHECGHIAGFHSLLWLVAGTATLSNPWLKDLLTWLGRHSGPWFSLGVFLLFCGCAFFGIRALLIWFEHQADDYAVDTVGLSAALESLAWLRGELFGTGPAPWVDERINRLRGLRQGVEDGLP